MRHGTRQLFGKRARHGAQHPDTGLVLRRHVAGFYSAVDTHARQRACTDPTAQRRADLRGLRRGRPNRQSQEPGRADVSRRLRDECSEQGESGMTRELDKAEGQPAAKTRRKPPTTKLEWGDDGVFSIELNGDWDRITRASVHETVSSVLLTGAALLGSKGNRVDGSITDFVLGFVDAMEPRDAAEAMLLTQMGATHQATMALARRLNHVDTIPQQDAAERALNKCARTFASQMDTLKRYRSKGQQTVRVERVTVQDGGQAIVGNVETGGRGQ
jgi:hypothetical protein